jgi:hypothetical protein
MSAAILLAKGTFSQYLPAAILSDNGTLSQYLSAAILSAKETLSQYLSADILLAKWALSQYLSAAILLAKGTLILTACLSTTFYLKDSLAISLCCHPFMKGLYHYHYICLVPTFYLEGLSHNSCLPPFYLE